MHPTELNPRIGPFPAGLNDCYAGLEWLHERRDELGVSTVCVAGESGGGNLSVATAMLAMRNGALHLCQSGVFTLCPQLAAFGGDRMGAVGYGVEAFDEGNPLAWPDFATPEDLRGFPRTVVSVNEDDAIGTDAGVALYRKLLAAGVDAQCRVVMGTPHAADIMGWLFVPEICLSTARAMADFAGGGAVLEARMVTELPAPAPRA